MAQTELRDSSLRAWLELPYFPFIFALLSYDCPLQSLKGIANSSSLARIMEAKGWPVDSSVSKNPMKCLSISDTTLMTTDSCSVWLMSGVQSRIIAKNFAC